MRRLLGMKPTTISIANSYSDAHDETDLIDSDENTMGLGSLTKTSKCIIVV